MRFKYIFAAIALLGFIVFCTSLLIGKDRDVKKQKIEFQAKTIDLKAHQLKGQELETKLESELQRQDKNQERIKQLEEENAKYQQETQELQKQVKAKQEAQRVAANKAATAVANVIAPKVSAQGSKGYCGDNMYKQYIYQHESGCDTDRYNSIGCYGIGQSCPASKIAHCGADFACQDAWFTEYANSRYGSWAGAYNWWLEHSWW